MEHQGSADELLANWSLAPGDMALLDGLARPGRLGLAVQLAFWRRHSRFPDDDADKWRPPSSFEPTSEALDRSFNARAREAVPSAPIGGPVPAQMHRDPQQAVQTTQ
jgi:hypothetical protein